MPSKSGSDSFDKLCMIFHLLSDKTRLQIVTMLSEREHSVTELCEELKLAQPTVSHHLGLLRMNNVISNKRQGKRVLYTLDPGVAKATGGKLRLQAPPYNVAVEGL
jgi:DNA-binding transcriptional ArsR family regulator